ncbi:MAG: formylmethanofuran--tetrahydromethanopterin N-formyltransferase [Candidatus Hodarchaeota archaeon]
MKLVEIEDTYAEAFDGTVCQLLVTAKTEKLLKKAVYSFTALPSTVFGDAEGGLVKWVQNNETPDGRLGAIVQLWTTGYNKKSIDTLYDKLGRRSRQGILVVPTTSIFNSLDSENYFNMMNNVGHCGDGFEEIIEKYSKKLISIPIMFGQDFLIEENIGYQHGIMGGNLWFFCDSIESALNAGDKAVDAILKINGTITSFDICSAGSKVETNYPEIGPTTNHWFCPTLKGKIDDSKVPKGVKSIPEIVINGIDMDHVKLAMRQIIEEVKDSPGLLKISAGNFGGKLGKHKIYLKNL